MKLLIILPLMLFIFSCSRISHVEYECTKVKEVLNCSNGTCRVLFENNDRYNTGVIAKGDLFCKGVYVSEDLEREEQYNGRWFLYNSYEDICKNSENECTIIHSYIKEKKVVKKDCSRFKCDICDIDPNDGACPRN